MKTKRNLLLAMAASLLPFAGSSAFAIALGDSGAGNNAIGAWQSGSGGEFYFQPTSGLVTNGSYDTTTKDQGGKTGSFQTFCLEKGEWLDSPVNYVVNDEALLGGTNSHAPAGNQGGDTLSVGTAWLYEQFARGILQGYNYGNLGLPNRKADAAELQNAIWALEDEIDDPTGNYYFNLAVANNGGTAASAQANATTGYLGVWVLNNTEPDTNTKRQDMLFYSVTPGQTNVPDGGTTVALLGLALSGLALARRKLG